MATTIADIKKSAEQKMHKTLETLKTTPKSRCSRGAPSSCARNTNAAPRSCSEIGRAHV